MRILTEEEYRASPPHIQARYRMAIASTAWEALAEALVQQDIDEGLYPPESRDTGLRSRRQQLTYVRTILVKDYHLQKPSEVLPSPNITREWLDKIFPQATRWMDRHRYLNEIKRKHAAEAEATTATPAVAQTPVQEPYVQCPRCGTTRVALEPPNQLGKLAGLGVAAQFFSGNLPAFLVSSIAASRSFRKPFFCLDCRYRF